MSDRMNSPSPMHEKSAAAPWILAVDDEPSMLHLIESVLQTKGWKVRLAEGAEEAFEALDAAGKPPSLVICDVLMPRVDGLELVRRMCARIPGLTVIFISGHLADVSWWPNDLRDHRFLAKPFANEELAAAVSEALGEEYLPG
jgi:DNA-binding NtrC family response regulator